MNCQCDFAIPVAESDNETVCDRCRRRIQSRNERGEEITYKPIIINGMSPVLERQEITPRDTK